MQLFHYGICSNFKRKNTKVKKYKYCERKRTSEHLSNCLTILNIHKLWQLTNYSYTKVFRALIERYIYVAELNVNGHLAINNRCIWCTCELSYLYAHIVARMGEQLSAAKDYTRVYWFWQGATCFKLPCLEAIFLTWVPDSHVISTSGSNHKSVFKLNWSR